MIPCSWYLAVNLFIKSIVWLATNTRSLDNRPIPNILFILVDDLGWNDIGFHGSSDFDTPNIDSLATNHGLQLNNYYVHSLCSPTRAALLSGRYSIRTGMQHMELQPNDPYGLALEFTLLSEDLQRAGYDTYLFGKWHLGYFNEEYTPTFRGFDTFYGYYNDAEDFFNHTVSIEYDGAAYERYDLMDNNNTVNDIRLHTYSTFIYGNKTLDALRRFSDNTDPQKQPFFIYLSLQNVHSPLQAPQEIMDTIDISDVKRKIKAAKATMVDDLIGEIVQELDDTTLWHNTLIIFSTDNGAASHDGGSNFPLRGSKGTLWEGAVRGTAFLSGGYLNISRHGDITNELLHVTDFYPTICDIVGIEATDSLDLDGKSFVNILHQEQGKSQREEVLLNIDPVDCNNSYNVCGAIRIGDWKLLVGNIGNQVTKLREPQSDTDNICIAGWCTNTDFNYHDTKTLSSVTVECPLNDITTQLDASNIYNTCPFNGEPCLFNIKNDPCEFHDIKDNHTDILNRAMERLKFWKTQSVTPLNVLNIGINPVQMASNTHWVPWKNTSQMIMWNRNISLGVITSNPTMEPTISSAISDAPTQSLTVASSSQTPTVSPSESHVIVSNTTDPTQVPTDHPTRIISTSSSTEISTSTSSPSSAPILSTTLLPSVTMLSSTALSPVVSTSNPSVTNAPSVAPTKKPTSSSVTLLPTKRPITTMDPSNAPSSAPTFAPTDNPTNTKRIVTEVASKTTSKYMGTFYLASISSLVGCTCIICFCVYYKRLKGRNALRHRRLEDALRGIELRSIVRVPPAGGEYSGLLM